MHVGQIIAFDGTNGVGIRLSLFVSGCTNRCKGCFQPQTWDFNFGRLYTPEMEDYIINELSNDYYRGITILGGEPMEFENQPEVADLILRIKRELPQKNVWIYTGFTYDKDLVSGGRRYGDRTDDILDNTDVLVDGKFILEQKDLTLQFRGSANQRLIDMKKTRKSGEVILLDL